LKVLGGTRAGATGLEEEATRAGTALSLIYTDSSSKRCCLAQDRV